jgi:GNAT superfamily N-acetyltransferase
LRGLCPGGVRRLSERFAAAAALHPAESHWYLAFVGVEPNLQRARVGTLLLAPVLALADRDRTPCYLETPFPETHAFYRRLGFQLVAELAPFPQAPSVSVMLRAPGATGS